MPLNSSYSRMPMYSRIQLKILGQIQNGSLRPGDQLPTESDLARQYQVSRITAKRALDELVRQGRAFRQQGRGTFVAQTQLHDISGFGSFTEDMRARGLRPGAQVLMFKEIRPDPQLQARLQLEKGDLVYLLKRLRLVDQEPVAVETAYLPCKLCQGLLDEDLNDHSLYAILSDKYRITPTWADAEFEARTATREEAALLKYRAGKPVLSARRLTFSANYDVIESVNSVYRGDRFTFYSGRLLIG
jgi:GntR family transcriptional regulator, N-acetylglucosamine utilization regulator